jgi:hypothetical protein
MALVKAEPEVVRIKVTLSGCDDSTTFIILATKEQVLFLEDLSKNSKETSTYGCMPVLTYEVLE